MTDSEITEVMIQKFAEWGRERIANGTASIFDHFNVAYAESDAETRKRALDDLLKDSCCPECGRLL